MRKLLHIFCLSLLFINYAVPSMASTKDENHFKSSISQEEDLSPEKFFCENRDISETEINLYFKKLSERYSSIREDINEWVYKQGRVCGRNLALDVDMQNLWASYQPCSNYYSQWLAGYKRVWPYDASLGLFAVMVENDFERATLGAYNFMDVMRAEKKQGYRGLYHFSYNTDGDDFIDPREPQGATQWVLKSLYVYMLETGDLRFYKELTMHVITDVLPLQITTPGYPAYGLLRQGYTHPDGLGQGGYNIYENLEDLNMLSHRVNLEHNADFIDLLRLMCLAYDKYKDSKAVRETTGPEFRDELRKRHALVMQAVQRLRKDAHFPTAFDEEGNANWSRAIDHYTWLSHTFIDVKNNDDIPWDSIKILYDEFSTSIKSIAIKERDREERVALEKPARGIFFFQQTFGDCFVSIDAESRERLEKMIQPEATAGAIIMLMDFIRATDNPYRRWFALSFMYELFEGLAEVHQAYKSIPYYKGGGMPYATEFIFDYFGPDPAIAASATYQIAIAKLEEDYRYFLGVPAPEGFEDALLERVDPSTLPDPIPLPTYLTEVPSEVIKKTGTADELAQMIKFKQVAVKNGQLYLNLQYPEELFHDLEVIVFKKTDVWYVQPRSLEFYSAGQRLPRSGVLKQIKTFDDQLDKNTLVVIARRGHGLRHDSALLKDELRAFYNCGDFITMSTVKDDIKLDLPKGNDSPLARRVLDEEDEQHENKPIYCSPSLTNRIRQQCVYR